VTIDARRDDRAWIRRHRNDLRVSQP
jgi:hypothetical protein